MGMHLHVGLGMSSWKNVLLITHLLTHSTKSFREHLNLTSKLQACSRGTFLSNGPCSQEILKDSKPNIQKDGWDVFP